MFEKSFVRVLQLEGGFSDHPADKGGKTMWGITERTARAAGYSGPISAMTQDQAKRIYYDWYWFPHRCDNMPDAMAFQIFDVAVNMGPARAREYIKRVQKMVNTSEDGVFGANSRDALDHSEYTLQTVCFKLLSLRLFDYTTLAQFSVFGKGWSRRVVRCMEHALEDCAK